MNSLASAPIFEQIDDPDKAISACGSALAIRNDIAEIHNNMGILYLRQHKFGEALRCFGLALEINPHSLAARNNRGNSLKDLGDYAGASAEYARALDLKNQSRPCSPVVTCRGSSNA